MTDRRNTPSSAAEHRERRERFIENSIALSEQRPPSRDREYELRDLRSNLESVHREGAQK